MENKKEWTAPALEVFAIEEVTANGGVTHDDADFWS